MLRVAVLGMVRGAIREQRATDLHEEYLNARKAVGETSAGKLLSGVHFLSKNAPVIFPPYHL